MRGMGADWEQPQTASSAALSAELLLFLDVCTLVCPNNSLTKGNSTTKVALTEGVRESSGDFLMRTDCWEVTESF